MRHNHRFVLLSSCYFALLIGAFIYKVYQHFFTGVIYSRSSAMTLVGMTLLTSMVTLAISSNIVISLGMVGALSIVRYRTAVKDPMDLLLPVLGNYLRDYGRGRYVCPSRCNVPCYPTDAYCL